MNKLLTNEERQRLNHYKNEHRKLNYTQVEFALKKELVEKFKAKCKADGIKYSDVIKHAINDFISE